MDGITARRRPVLSSELDKSTPFQYALIVVIIPKRCANSLIVLRRSQDDPGYEDGGGQDSRQKKHLHEEYSIQKTLDLIPRSQNNFILG
jgi:hypothetical protein